MCRFSFDSQSEDIVVIEGRKTGLIQWLLVQLKFGNIYRIHVQRDMMSYSTESASCKSLSFTRLQVKPIGYLILAVLLLVAGLVLFISGILGGTLAYWVVAVIFYVIYTYLKSFFITIGTEDNVRYGFSFRKALVENVSIDIEKIEVIVECINQLIVGDKCK